MLCNCCCPAGAPGARALAAAVTDKLDDSQISHIRSSSEHEAFLQKSAKLAMVGPPPGAMLTAEQRVSIAYCRMSNCCSSIKAILAGSVARVQPFSKWHLHTAVIQQLMSVFQLEEFEHECCLVYCAQDKWRSANPGKKGHAAYVLSV
jgi:hypothetical protein